MSKYSLLLFDLDDTLLTNSTWFSAGLIQTLGMHSDTKNLDASSFLEQVMHVPNSLLERFKSRELTPTEFKRARWRHAFAHFNLHPDLETIDQFDTLFFQTSMVNIEINTPVTSLLNELKRYYDVGIVTNGLYDSRIKIRQMGLCDVFSEDTIFHAEHLGYRKPDPEIYLTALQHFGKEPKETLFIGDSWIHDVVGPMEIGMKAIWVNGKGVAPSTKHTPVAVVSEVTEIRNILLNELLL